jgi:hypothetical protein
MSEPRALVEHFFRHQFGRLCALPTRSLGVRRLDLVEDVVQAALVQASVRSRFVLNSPKRFLKPDGLCSEPFTPTPALIVPDS